MSSPDMRNGGLGKWKDLNGNDKLRKNLKMKVTFELKRLVLAPQRTGCFTHAFNHK